MYTLPGRETMVKKSKADGEKGLDAFRTIVFDEWLRLFMQVSCVIFMCGIALTSSSVLF
jgi:hypothetical protein